MKKIFLLIIFFSHSLMIFSQVAGGKIDKESLMQEELKNQLQDNDLLSKDEFPVGNKVNPDNYYIGPGDILSIQILPMFLSPVNVKVSPENTLIIPKFTEFNIDEMTLTEVKDTVRKYFKNINKNSTVSLSLFKPRTVLVKIEGDVAFPKTYSLPSSYTVSTAIRFANQIYGSDQAQSQQLSGISSIQKNQKDNEERFSNSGLPSEDNYASRNITVLHNDGTNSKVDIEKAIALNETELDPYVKEGDIIIVPYKMTNYQRISITGAVNKPKVLPYKKGDKLSFLFAFGRGFTENADYNNIFLVNSNTGDRKKIQVSENGELITEDFEIAPGSVLVVGFEKEENIATPGLISIKGEVNNPGVYLINSDKTNLKDAIEMAGGFTDEAYLPLANIVRREDRDLNLIDPKEEAYEKFLSSNLIMQDTLKFYLDIKYRNPYVSSDFQELFDNNTEDYNIILKDGDIINVPKNPGNVFVFGQVKNPGFVDFKPGKNMDYYIEKCGGVTSGADDSRSSIIRGKNNVWVEGDDETFVYAGDQIYVPSPPAYPPNFEIQKYNTYVYMISGIVGVVNTILIIFSRN